MTKLFELAMLGQSVWLDYIQRGFINSGELQKLIDLGVRGMTSNPTIFEKAINGSDHYDLDLQLLAAQGKSAIEIYEVLAIDDIRLAADRLRPVYDSSQMADGYVSLEVNPGLANDTQGTQIEAQRLWAQVNRPNLMVKIPATKAGLPAITETIASGVNVNVTLIFSLERYKEVMEAYLKGIEKRLDNRQPVNHIASVASFFVSRMDSKVDKLLEAHINAEGPQSELATQLVGRLAVANTRLAYQDFRRVFESQRFRSLSSQGVRYQRPLWASTSTKNPRYSDILYVQELIGAHTVNTLPQNTLEAFLDHGMVELTIEDENEKARQQMQALAELGVSYEQITLELEQEGVAAFAKSFTDLIDSIEHKRQALAEKHE